MMQNPYTSLVRGFAVAAALTICTETVSHASSAASAVAFANLHGPTVFWEGRALEPGTLPAQWSAKTTERVQELTEWVQTDAYSVSVSSDERVVLLSPAGKMHAKRWKLVESVLAEFDRLVPTLQDRDLSGETYRVSDYGMGDHRPDAEPIVLIEAGDVQAYSKAVQSLVKQHPHLVDWSESVRTEPGFVESGSQTCAWMAAPEGFEIGDVWRSENELVHRAGALLLNRSYGPMPHWLRTAVGWHLEQAVLGDIYHFPMRHEFISVMGHGGWKSELKRAFKRGQSVPIDSFADWSMKEWNESKAEVAWGMVAYLATYHPGKLSNLAEAFRQHFKLHSVQEEGGGRWRRIEGYQIPAAEQGELIRTVLGEDPLEQAGRFFQGWKGPSRKALKKR